MRIDYFFPIHSLQGQKFSKAKCYISDLKCCNGLALAIPSSEFQLDVRTYVLVNSFFKQVYPTNYLVKYILVLLKVTLACVIVLVVYIFTRTSTYAYERKICGTCSVDAIHSISINTIEYTASEVNYLYPKWPVREMCEECNFFYNSMKTRWVLWTKCPVLTFWTLLNVRKSRLRLFFYVVKFILKVKNTYSGLGGWFEGC